MKKEKPAEYQLFYSEIPVENNTNANTANTSEYYYHDRITHAYDKPRKPALSRDGLTKLAEELLAEAQRDRHNRPKRNGQTLR